MIAELRDISGDSSAARSLPGRFYTSPEFFELEIENILSKEWHCLGRADEVAQPGDYFTTRLLKESLLVVRGNDGNIRVLSNVCRHRGMRVATGTGSATRFVCPYHGWSYGRDGACTVPSSMRGTAACGSYRLPQFRCEIWNGFIYVNLDDNAAPLAPRLPELGQLIADYQTERMRLVHVAQEEWRTNWKCLVENFMEAYHLSVVHPRTLRPYTPTDLSRKMTSSATFTSYAANYPVTAAGRGRGAPALSADERLRSTLFCVFPTHVASQAATLLASISIQPIAVDRINVRWTLSTYENELTQQEIDERISLWTEVNREDREVLETLQDTLASRHATSGPLGPTDYEGTIGDFTRYLSMKIRSESAI
jgi:phenylpropionate dioxygenase-like ring-hydroxylating dioxygenase large terminal subunit